MAGYVRKVLSIEQAIKTLFKKLSKDDWKEATGKSESHFRKCSAVDDLNHLIHHADSIKIDKYCMSKGMGHPMLDIHEEILDAELLDEKKLPRVSDTLITMGGRIGRLMDTAHQAIDPNSPDGSSLSQSEKDKISKAIEEVKDKLTKLSKLVDKEK